MPVCLRALVLACSIPAPAFAQFGLGQLVTSGNGAGATHIEIADVNGDGIPDAVAKTTGLVFYPGLGGGNFGAEQLITTGFSWNDLFVVDVDNDGDTDLVTSFPVEWYENDGLGVFTKHTVPGVVNSNLTDVVDLDGDGDVDLLSELAAGPLWSPNLDGLGTFGSPINVDPVFTGCSAVAGSDVDGDGDLDMVAGGIEGFLTSVIRRYPNDGSGSFGTPLDVSAKTGFPRLIASADLDADGDQDLVNISTTANLVAWFKNNDGLGSFGPEITVDIFAGGVQTVVIEDLGGDGDLDLLVPLRTQDFIVWYPNDGTGDLTKAVLASTVDAPMDVAAGDIDGDGDIDVASASQNDAKLAWYPDTDGSATWGSEIVLTSPTVDPYDVVAADLDGDLAPELLVASRTSDELAWFGNDGLGTFGGRNVIDPSVNFAQVVHAADLDGDGDQDVLGGGSLDWYENTDAAGTFGSGTSLATSIVESIDTADIDGDGDLDVLADAPGAVWFENNDSPSGFSEPRSIAFPSGDLRLSAGDLDGDGDADVVLTADSSNWVTWYVNFDGQGTFGVQSIPGALPTPIAHRLGDMDGDGDLDLVISTDNGTIGDGISWHRNVDGLGTFGPAQGIALQDLGGPPAVTRVEDIEVADLDANGTLDLVLADGGKDRIHRIQGLPGGGFGPLQVVADGLTNVGAVAVADLDGDADPDVAFAARDLNQVGWYENGACPGPVAALEVVRAGPNPGSLMPGQTSGPVIGATWDPYIDHTMFMPGAIGDFLGLTVYPLAGLPLPPFGTLLCDIFSTPPTLFSAGVGQPFLIAIPNDCAFVWNTYCVQGFSVSPTQTLLTNALDITIGNF